MQYRVKTERGNVQYQVYCPECNRPHTVQRDNRHPMRTSIAEHMLHKHGLGRDIVYGFAIKAVAAMREGKRAARIADAERLEAARKVQAENDARRIREFTARSKAKITLSCDDVERITDEIDSLIRMMEPYYSQGNCDYEARMLIEELNERLNVAAGLKEQHRNDDA